ncbi:hypothetical protein [Sphingomonas sp. LHG3406-1]|uniref:hypothetical protein n=1 Tax=Sphingomonas sp. LHG3406-1 TaxID=2804617 RepID=UPI0026101571|nr:hypothetical protein [Sphingomonas sp. LHG3406-1]
MVPAVPVQASARLLLFGGWLVLVLVLASQHVPWKDETRAFALATTGGNWIDMLRAMHGEGHPALWYMILRALHDLWPSPMVLPIAGLMIGIALSAVFVMKAPFRLPILLVVAFSSFLLFHHTVVARNYGLASLILFPMAAWWPRLRDSPWLGLLLLLLCNTAVPTVFLAGGIYLYRALSVVEEQGLAWTRTMRVLLVNGALLLLGALLCFAAVYPTANDAAAALSSNPLEWSAIPAALLNDWRSLDYAIGGSSGLVLTLLSLLTFARNRPALVAALVTLILFRLFFYFVYPASYRHSAQLIVFLLALLWITLQEPGRAKAMAGRLVALGQASFLCLLTLQMVFTGEVLHASVAGVPYSRAKQVAEVIRREKLDHAIVTGQPDTAMEPIAYQMDRDVWLMRQDRSGRISPLTVDARRHFSFPEMLASVERLHRATGRPVVIVLLTPLSDPTTRKTVRTGFLEDMTLDPADFARFERATRRIASLGPAKTDESYEVFVYPR